MGSGRPKRFAQNAHLSAKQPQPIAAPHCGCYSSPHSTGPPSGLWVQDAIGADPDLEEGLPCCISPTLPTPPRTHPVASARATGPRPPAIHTEAPCPPGERLNFSPPCPCSPCAAWPRAALPQSYQGTQSTQPSHRRASMRPEGQARRQVSGSGAPSQAHLHTLPLGGQANASSPPGPAGSRHAPLPPQDKLERAEASFPLPQEPLSVPCGCPLPLQTGDRGR